MENHDFYVINNFTTVLGRYFVIQGTSESERGRERKGEGGRRREERRGREREKTVNHLNTL